MTTYVAQASTGADALVTTRSVTTPGGVTANDVGAFILVRWHESGSFPAVTPPAGAVLRGTITNSSVQSLVYLHRVNAEASFAYSWTGSRWSALEVQFARGVDPSLDLSTVPFHSLTGSGTAVSTLTVTTVADAFLAWHVNTIATSGVTHSPPTSFTETGDVSPWAAAYRISPGAGSQSASGATFSPTGPWAAGLIALAPAAGGTSQPLPVAAETGTARTFSGAKARALPPSAAAEGAEPFTGSKQAVLGAAGAAEAALPLAAAKDRALGAAGSAETAQPLAGGKTATTGAATAIETARPFTGSKTAALGAATETNTARPAAGVKSGALSPAQESGAARPIAGSKAAVLGTAVEADAARPFGTPGGAPLGPAVEEATAQPLTGMKTAALSTAVETATARPVGGTKRAAIGVAAETGQAMPLGQPVVADIDITVGEPHSLWAVAEPYGSAWEVSAPA